jgi:hypothetical protein
MAGEVENKEIDRSEAGGQMLKKKWSYLMV